MSVKGEYRTTSPMSMKGGDGLHHRGSLSQSDRLYVDSVLHVGSQGKKFIIILLKRIKTKGYLENKIENKKGQFQR